MGFRDIRLVNQALLARQAWRLVFYPESLCARVLKAKYFPRGNLLDTVTAGDASPSWRGIEHGLALLKHGVLYRVGDGRSIRIWRDNWIPRAHGMKPIGSARQCRLRWVTHLIDAQARSWDETLVRRYFYPCDVEEILKIKIPPTECPDYVAWNFEKSGLFSVKSAYRLAMRKEHGEGEISTSSTPLDGRKVWKDLWSTHVPGKVKVFAWKIANNGIPTQANKCYRHLVQHESCEMCGYHSEDCFHACVQCPHAVALRQAMREHWSLPSEEDLLYTGPQWLLILMNKYSKEVNANLFMLLWRVWSVRNSVLRAGQTISVNGSVVFLTRYMDSLVQCRHTSLQPDSKGKRCAVVGNAEAQGRGRQEQKQWIPPDPGWLKINVDGAFLPASGAAAVGIIIRDHDGHVKLAAWRVLRHCRDAEEAEAVACCEGITLAARWPDIPMTLETDCAWIVDSLKNQRHDLSINWSTLLRGEDEDGGALSLGYC